MDTKKSIEFYIIVFLILLGASFALHYYIKGNALDIVYAILLLLYGMKLSYIKFKKVK